MFKLTISKFRALIFCGSCLVPTFVLASQLHDLVRADNVQAVRDYLQFSARALFEINSQDDSGLTPMEIARSLSNTEMETLLKEYGAEELGPNSGSPFRRPARLFRTGHNLIFDFDATEADPSRQTYPPQAIVKVAKSAATSSRLKTLESEPTSDKEDGLAGDGEGFLPFAMDDLDE